MPQTDMGRVLLRDIAMAVGLLTRLPVQLDFESARARSAAAAWAWPLAGVLVGTVVWAVGMLALWGGLSVGFAAGLALGAGMVVSGAMHEDGLADTADGFWGGWTPERRLEIMKDSHIGTYGVLALVGMFLLRWLGLSAVFGGCGAVAGLGLLTSLAAITRLPMVVLIHALPNARGVGLAQSVGKPARGVVVACAAVVLALSTVGFAMAGMIGLLPSILGAVAVATLGVGLLARAKICGQTGDILGAAQQISELVGLAVLMAALAS